LDQECETVDVKLARLEERMISFDQKADLYHEQDTAQHQVINDELSKMKKVIEGVVKNYSDRLNKNRDDINGVLRDRKWVIAIFGLLYGLMIAYIEYRSRG
jgi:hypothetical protein